MVTTFSRSNTLKAQVMRRVYIVANLRRALSPFALKFYFFAALLWEVGRQVWVARVIHNSPPLTHPLATVTFFANAFSHTHTTVQLLSLGVLFFALWLSADLWYKGRHFLTPAF